MRGKAYIVGAYEHPTRHATDRSLAQLHADVARGALEDAGLSLSDVDGYFCASDVPGWGAPGVGPFSMVEYLGIQPRHLDTTESWGSSYMHQVAQATRAIADGRCRVALITQAGRPRAERQRPQSSALDPAYSACEAPFETPYGAAVVNRYAMCAMRHQYEHGTTAEQLAWIKVAASHHAQHNPQAMLRNVVTVEDVLSSPWVAAPLRRLDCCVISDGGGALVLAHPAIARSLKRPLITPIGSGYAINHLNGGYFDLLTSGGAQSGADAFGEARLTPGDIDYASLYDSFTITVLIQLENLGFCAPGQGGAFVSDGKLISGVGPLAVNTDGGGLCNNHPGHRGGMARLIEAVRQLRGEAHPAVQRPHCALALAHGTGGLLGSRHGSATLILERL
ncbi:thiolase domain-containing protein [Pseudomonas sp. PA-6-1D]|jgi:acetyl-CoA C-acetyltransferase|uniref:thiolase domain-containing protein n=1 Tax=Pseudomonas TaxID=286 RepID=UPI000C15E1FE|nr:MULTISPECIES: thiolase domain-containing protein [Pseudomonas]MCF5140174.1 thiolase domain-containing protein [Pseudomonas sp. PA-6-3C]MCF5145357.1 thiolase domain-containing protein [Pseudomonas sp. PA-6-3F]MCF5157671.1 thiolase domain-containing protein [Pseudomonas sp. PA-6-2E]MCF5175837.1 thiolase domain-containing protein [Pseudomonas sp. PA-6-1D]MCF5191821.1 thiolase domain-containing protein [Pseudomonas sp. PA-6-1H]